MAPAAASIINAYLRAVDGAALDHSKQVVIGYSKNPDVLYVTGTPANPNRSFTDANDAVHAAALDVLQNLEVIGGDLLMKRAHQNSPSNIPEAAPAGGGIPGRSQVSGADQLATLAGDLSVAQDYENYLNNREAINALIAANPNSAFAMGWIATLARVNDLGLNHMSKSDFLGGLVGYLDSVNKAGLGAEAANAIVKRGSDNSVIVEIKVANGAEVPGALSVFADHLTITSDASGQTLQFTVDSGLGMSSTLLLGPGASVSSGHDILVGGAANDTMHGGAGWDFIDGGSGWDHLFGEDGNDILRGGLGNDDLQGGLGNDTYVFNRGDGVDTVLDDYTVTTTTTTWKTWIETRDDGTNVVVSGYVTETKTDHPNAGTDALVFGPGISRADIVVQRNGNDLIVGAKDPAHPGALTDQITLQRWFDADGFDRIEKFSFADGTTLDLSAGQTAIDAKQVPFGESLSRSSVVEKSAIGTVVGTVSGFDFNPNATLSYSLVNPDGRFAINSSTGVLTVAGSINYDDTHSLGVTVRASDQSGNGINQTFTINVIDIPNRAPLLSVPASTIKADPGQTLQVASWFNASDADNDALTYYFQDSSPAANSGHFVLNGTPVAANISFSVNAAQLATLTFVAGAEGVVDELGMQLSDGHAQSANLALHVSVNHAPVLSVPSGTITANAGQSLQVSSWFSASDADNDALTYYFEDDTAAANSGYFRLNGTPYAQGAGFTLTAAQLAGLTFVTSAAGVADDLLMQLSDGHALSAVGRFHIANLNRAPTDATLSGGSVIENAATGTHVATVTGVDPDANTTFSYSLRNPDGRFAINAATGEVTVAYGALLDYETSASQQITVRSADQSGLFFDKSFTIAVTDGPDAPTDATLFGGTVREHSANGTHVGTVIGADPDAGDVLRYSLLTDAGGRFAILNPLSGVITVKDGTLLDYATAQSWSLMVRTTDQAGLFYDRPLTVAVAAGPINNPDGTSTVTVYDGADAYGWASFKSTYNGPDGHGSLLSQLGANDGGSKWQNVYDVAHTQSWDHYTATFDPADHLLTKAVTYDDGTHSLLVNDVANTASWSSFTLHYDANWNYTSISDIVLDNAGSPPLDMGQVWPMLDTLTWYANPYAVGPAPSFLLSDFNGDGKSDLLLLNNTTHGFYVCEMNGAQMGLNALSVNIRADLGWYYKELGDFNGDRKSDSVLLNDTTHGVYICEMDGPVIGANGLAFTIRADLGWRYGGLGDFNNDGKSDIVLLNDLTHGVYVCEMDGLQMRDNGLTGTLDAGWAYKTLGDFNGDGKDDFLFLNDTTHGVKVWQMDGTELVADQTVGSIDAAHGWRFRDTADFNGDGKTDLLLLNDANNHVMVWQMNGTATPTQVDLGAAPDHFHFTDKGDFNGDGKTDLMFINDMNGTVKIWQMNGTAIDQSRDVGTIASGYHYAGAGDFNGDGKADLIFYSDQTREERLWQMNGTEILDDSHMVTLTQGWHLSV
jgi:hypothetical protein